MWQGIGTPLPLISNLPGASRPGAPGGLALVDNEFSMTFSNTDETYVQVTNLRNTLTANGNKKISFSGWFNANSIGTNITMFWNRNSGNGPITIESFGNKARVRIATNSVTTNNISQDVCIFANKWQHYFLVVDLENSTQTDIIRVYIDGERQTLTGTFPSTGDSFNLTQNQPDVLINTNRVTPLQVTNTIMQYDEFAFWDTVIDDKIIKQIYEANNTAGKTADLAQVSPSNLKAWLRMGDI